MFYETKDVEFEYWGQPTENDSYTGLLGDMNNGLADFALADIYYNEYHLQIMDLSIPYNTECLTFITPESQSDNSWKTLILPFQREMWGGIFVSLFCVGFIFFAFARCLIYAKTPKRFKYRPKREKFWRFWEKPKEIKFVCTVKIGRLRKKVVKRRPKDVFDTLSNCFLMTYSMLLLISLPRMPVGWSLRFLTGWYWIYCILIVVAYRASMTAILANPAPRVTIDTLKELVESNIKLGAWGIQNKNFFLTSNDDYGQKIGEKLEHAADPRSAVRNL
jgi:hypothetical protein